MFLTTQFHYRAFLHRENPISWNGPLSIIHIARNLFGIIEIRLCGMKVDIVNYITWKNRRGFFKINHAVSIQRSAIFRIVSSFLSHFSSPLLSFPPFLPKSARRQIPSRAQKGEMIGTNMGLKRDFSFWFVVNQPQGVKSFG